MRELRWPRELILQAPWRTVRLAQHRPAVTIISDASWAPIESGHGEAKLCWLVFCEGRAPWGRVCDLPISFLEVCATRKTQIAVAELLAAVLPQWVDPLLFKGTAVTMFIDHMTALCSLVMGAPELMT